MSRTGGRTPVAGHRPAARLILDISVRSASRASARRRRTGELSMRAPRTAHARLALAVDGSRRRRGPPSGFRRGDRREQRRSRQPVVRVRIAVNAQISPPAIYDLPVSTSATSDRERSVVRQRPHVGGVSHRGARAAAREFKLGPFAVEVQGQHYETKAVPVTSRPPPNAAGCAGGRRRHAARRGAGESGSMPASEDLTVTLLSATSACAICSIR